jgi:hypothetical protein
MLKELLSLTERELRILERRERYHSRIKAVSSGQITKDWLPIPVAAAVLGVTRRQVYKLIREKKLRRKSLVWYEGHPAKLHYERNWVTRVSVARYAQVVTVSKAHINSGF